jgi:hypothetical protein
MRRAVLQVTLSLLGAGCVEVDGPPLDSAQNALCPGGKPRRPPVSKEVLASFPTCCAGRGRLIPDFVIPKDFRPLLEAGPEGTLCVPEENADASYTPPACESVFGLKGACLSPCLPSVKNADIELPQAGCAGDLRCAPCLHPKTLQPTGACTLGQMACEPQGAPDQCQPFAPSPQVLQGLASCCEKQGGRAHCAAAKLVDEGLRKDLSPCDDGVGGAASGASGGYCVPDDLLARAGRHQPASCVSVGGREGRCLSVCVKSVADQRDTLPRASCAEDERCTPCYDPRTGLGTGACTVGPCDRPKDPPRQFEACGAAGGDALCVPADLVPAKDRCYFDAKGCGAGCREPATLCVPRKVIDAGPTFQGKKCTASLSGYLALFLTVFQNPFDAMNKLRDYSDGCCISKCLPNVRAQASLLSSSGCDADEVCAPCFDPTKLAEGKVPTGACERPDCK